MLHRYTGEEKKQQHINMVHSLTYNTTVYTSMTNEQSSVTNPGNHIGGGLAVVTKSHHSTTQG